MFYFFFEIKKLKKTSSWFKLTFKDVRLIFNKEYARIWIDFAEKKNSKL